MQDNTTPPWQPQNQQPNPFQSNTQTEEQKLKSPWYKSLFANPALKPIAFVGLFVIIGLSTQWASFATTQSYSIWDNNTVPNVISTNDPQGAELGTKFKSLRAGEITGIRFYKSAQNTGTHTGTLWDNNGREIANVTFSNESATGWQTATLLAPVPILANTTYVVSYHTSTGFYSADSNYFKSSGRATKSLVALRNGMDGQNGLRTYSTSTTFPTGGDAGTNYWVDVVFSTATN